jgi:hypothetical protein
MARVDITLADEVKRYAAAHRQPMSVVIRDALLFLMEEYPCSADLSAPHRLGAHEFLSDRYESSLDTLLGETDSAGLEALLSDTNEETVETILEETNGASDIVSDTKEGIADIVSDDNTDQAETHRETPARAQARKARPVMRSKRGHDAKRGTWSRPERSTRSSSRITLTLRPHDSTTEGKVDSHIKGGVLTG